MNTVRCGLFGDSCSTNISDDVCTRRVRLKNWVIRQAYRHALRQRAVLPRLAHALQEQRLRPRLHVLCLEILRDVEAIHRAGATPDAGEIGRAVRCPRRRGSEIHLAVGQTRRARRRIVDPLRRRGCREDRERDDGPAEAGTITVPGHSVSSAQGRRLYACDVKPHPACSSGRSVRTLSNASIKQRVDQLLAVAAPSTGAIRSRALSTTSARDIGLRTVPRTASTRSEPRPVLQRDLDDRDTHREQRRQPGVRHVGHLAPLPQHLRILHPRFVVRRPERGRAVEQHHRDHVLQADVRDVAVVDDGADTRREAHHDALTSSAANGCLRRRALDRVERRLDRCADGPLLDVGVDDLVALAEPRRRALRVARRAR